MICLHFTEASTCRPCRAMAWAMGIVRNSTPVPGWYSEQLVEAWGRACGITHPQLVLDKMAFVEPIEVRNLAPVAR